MRRFGIDSGLVLKRQVTTLRGKTCLPAGASQVESLASGQTTLLEVRDNLFLSWLSRMVFIPVSERPVEGWHSRVTSLVKRSPNCDSDAFRHARPSLLRPLKLGH